MEPAVVVTIALAFWPLWVAFAATWVVSRLEKGKPMLGAVVLLCIAVLFFAPLLFALGRIDGTAVISLVLAAFAALTAVALS